MLVNSGSEDNLQVAVVERGTTSQRRLLFSRPLALRPIYWEISSDAYTYFKMEYESELNTEIFGVRRFLILD